jgi:hypothetical protein
MLFKTQLESLINNAIKHQTTILHHMTAVQLLSCSFTIRLAGLRVFVNDQRTRTFLAVALKTGEQEVGSRYWSLWKSLTVKA